MQLTVTNEEVGTLIMAMQDYIVKNDEHFTETGRDGVIYLVNKLIKKRRE